ncbi:type III-A CRISPR-associated protein Cas10/Csm1 [candidate division KSB1 bacterium]|nr:type III-A CRISPR-associated protein Cas10/Csm1 [candidate division KSB1 bacterium]
MDLKRIILGAMLHDIGKFRMRAFAPVAGKDHSAWGAEWLEQFVGKGLSAGVAVIAGWHHKKYLSDIKNSNETLIVYEADNLAAQSEREVKDDAKYNPANVPLCSILSTLSLGTKRNKPSYFPLTEQDNNIVIPVKLEKAETGQEKYKKLWDRFENDFSKWCDAGCHINTLPALLEKYCSFIPSETLWNPDDEQKHPDISLFDHQKSTAAIAACLYRFFTENFSDSYTTKILEYEICNKSDERFCLIGGDLSGVQNFIYTISSRGALKTLRARSFFLDLFCEHLVTQLLNLLGLPRANIIFTGGGHFYLLVHNTKSVHQIIKTVRDKTNLWLFENFGFKLFLALTKTTFSGDELKTEKMAGIWRNIGIQLGNEKRQKYAAFAHDLLQPLDPVLPEAVCQVCYRDDVELVAPIPNSGIDNICGFCSSMWKIGSRLPKIKYIVQKEQPGELSFAFPDFSGNGQIFLHFCEKPDVNRSDVPVYAINRTDIYESRLSGMITLLNASYTRVVRDLALQPAKPAGADDTAGLADLAVQSRGRDLLGVLRMDVDNLGKLFLSGLPEKKRTFTRLAAVSRSLSFFFKSCIPALLNGQVPSDFNLSDFGQKNPQKYGRNAAIVYAGGDDLFITGAWDEIIDISFDIHQVFQAFCGFNPDLTISGGFVVQKPDFPLYRLAESAARAEQAAKDCGRNAMTLFYTEQIRSEGDREIFQPQTISWNDMERQMIEPLKLFLAEGKIADYDKGNYFDSSKLSRNHLTRMLQIVHKWERDGILYLPAMAWLVGKIKNNFKNTALGTLLMDPAYIADLKHVMVWILLAGQRISSKKQENFYGI